MRRRGASSQQDLPSRHPQGGKFGTVKDPLEIEETLQNMRPQPLQKEERKRLLQICNQLINSGNLQRGEVKALQIYKTSLITDGLQSAVHEEFQRDFWRWLLGRGTDGDTNKTPWGRRSLAYDPEVSSYIDQWVVKRANYQMKLKLLETRVPIGINQAYLYFKYIVRGEKIDETNFLKDWDIMVQEFEGGREFLYGGRQRGDDHREPGRLPHETAPYGDSRAKRAQEFYEGQKGPPVDIGRDFQYDSEKYNRGGGYDSDDDDWTGPSGKPDDRPQPPKNDVTGTSSPADGDGKPPPAKPHTPEGQMAVIAETLQKIADQLSKRESPAIPADAPGGREERERLEKEERRLTAEQERLRAERAEIEQRREKEAKERKAQFSALAKQQKETGISLDRLSNAINNLAARNNQWRDNINSDVGNTDQQAAEMVQMRTQMQSFLADLHEIMRNRPSDFDDGAAAAMEIENMRNSIELTELLAEIKSENASFSERMERRFQEMESSSEVRMTELAKSIKIGLESIDLSVNAQELATQLASGFAGAVSSEQLSAIRDSLEQATENLRLQQAAIANLGSAVENLADAEHVAARQNRGELESTNIELERIRRQTREAENRVLDLTAKLAHNAELLREAKNQADIASQSGMDAQQARLRAEQIASRNGERVAQLERSLKQSEERKREYAKRVGKLEELARQNQRDMQRDISDDRKTAERLATKLPVPPQMVRTTVPPPQMVRTTVPPPQMVRTTVPPPQMVSTTAGKTPEEIVAQKPEPVPPQMVRTTVPPPQMVRTTVPPPQMVRTTVPPPQMVSTTAGKTPEEIVAQKPEPVPKEKEEAEGQISEDEDVLQKNEQKRIREEDDETELAEDEKEFDTVQEAQNYMQSHPAVVLTEAQKNIIARLGKNVNELKNPDETWQEYLNRIAKKLSLEEDRVKHRKIQDVQGRIKSSSNY